MCLFKKNEAKCEKSVTLCCLKGTPAFMAPEVLKNRHVSTAADVYGFGIILWEMSVALKPFHGMDLVEVRLALSLPDILSYICCYTPPSFHLLYRLIFSLYWNAQIYFVSSWTFFIASFSSNLYCMK